ncbi:MAG: hypothetical protein DRN54_01680 [Thaumarchaeota archaeon]|nr:MAG: hypothetical protein DRN54_01680 [Nitrososphaerota archaeon]
MNYGGLLGVILTGVALLLAIIALVLSSRKPKIALSKTFLMKDRVLRGAKIFMIGILMLTADMFAYVLHSLDLLERGPYVIISIACGSGLAITSAYFFYELIRIITAK